MVDLGLSKKPYGVSRGFVRDRGGQPKKYLRYFLLGEAN